VQEKILKLDIQPRKNSGTTVNHLIKQVTKSVHGAAILWAQAEAWQRLGWALAQVKILSIFFD
jgi:hypothetical protein